MGTSCEIFPLRILCEKRHRDCGEPLNTGESVIWGRPLQLERRGEETRARCDEAEQGREGMVLGGIVGLAGGRSERPFQYLFRFKAFIGGSER
jgi:hypothetical protein